MRFASYGDFARYLGTVGELHRVTVEVDPYLEITEIATRALKEGKPAIWFDNVKGSRFPLVINAMASERRCELALQKHPAELGRELIALMTDALPPTLPALMRHRPVLRRFLSSPARMTGPGPAQEVSESPDLDTLPVLHCWPEDGGRFVTLPQVITEHPLSRKRNIGMYRMHVFDRRTTGMHWQIQKGGGFHYHEAEREGKPLEVAVALGTDPALVLATIAALPENIDEAMFAGFLRGRRVPFTRSRTLSIAVPAEAEFVLEGTVAPRERRMEGPFGDHFGHYSHAAEFPVFRISSVTRRRDAVYPATVVGIPPMEDKFLGDATQQVLGPLAKLIHSEITDVWAYYEAGFHNLLVVAVDQRYAKEAMKTALGLMGTGQLSLTKSIVLVSQGVDVKDFGAVMRQVRDHFDPHFDFVMIPRVPLDTLDFTSYTMNLGSKMILDATRKARAQEFVPPVAAEVEARVAKLKGIDARILDLHLMHDTLLLVKVRGLGMPVVEKLVRHTELPGVRMVAAVSEDVNIRDRESAIWGVFTRFDCERDILFTEQKLIGISPVYKGIMGIDATWKQGYPKPLTMPDEVRKKVEERWDSYWR
jgi:4-hydroxy-3-polyprenylbenzoate decarboxylase